MKISCSARDWDPRHTNCISCEPEGPARLRARVAWTDLPRCLLLRPHLTPQSRVSLGICPGAGCLLVHRGLPGPPSGTGRSSRSQRSSPRSTAQRARRAQGYTRGGNPGPVSISLGHTQASGPWKTAEPHSATELLAAESRCADRGSVLCAPCSGGPGGAPKCYFPCPPELHHFACPLRAVPAALLTLSPCFSAPPLGQALPRAKGGSGPALACTCVKASFSS